MENNKLEIFKNEEFGEVRTTILNGKPYFCGSDIAKILGYAKPQNAISVHCRGALKQGIGVQTGTKANGAPALQTVEMMFIPEGDVYRLIMKSKLPSAEKFESWVMDEVLPTIRKTGGYINNVDLMVNTYFSDIPDEQKGIVKGLLVNIEEKQKKINYLNNENDLLAQKNLEWADRPLINSLVRAYASSIENDFGKAWNNFKKELLYKYSINLNSRITAYLNTSDKKTKPKTLDMLDDSEIPNAISTIVSMCKENNVIIDELINNKAI